MDNHSEFDRDDVLKQLLDRVLKGGAHVDFSSAVAGIDWKQSAEGQETLPYTIWQLAEHIRITQFDIIEFCRDPSYQSPSWPDGYWPEKRAPESPEIWEATVSSVVSDQQLFAELMRERRNELMRRFEHGDGQSFFNEALLIMDHNAYHVGQIVLIRKLKGWWN